MLVCAQQFSQEPQEVQAGEKNEGEAQLLYEFPLPALRHSTRVLLAAPASATSSPPESEAALAANCSSSNSSNPTQAQPQLQAAAELAFADCEPPERLRALQAIVELAHRTVAKLGASSASPRASSARPPELSALCFSLLQFRAARNSLSVPATGTHYLYTYSYVP